MLSGLLGHIGDRGAYQKKETSDKTIRPPQDGHKTHIQQGMLRWIIFARTIHPLEATPPTMFSRIKEQAHKGHWHAQFTNVMSSFFSSCMIMMICSG